MPRDRTMHLIREFEIDFSVKVPVVFRAISFKIASSLFFWYCVVDCHNDCPLKQSENLGLAALKCRPGGVTHKVLLILNIIKYVWNYVIIWRTQSGLALPCS